MGNMNTKDQVQEVTEQQIRTNEPVSFGSVKVEGKIVRLSCRMLTADVADGWVSGECRAVESAARNVDKLREAYLRKQKVTAMRAEALDALDGIEEPPDNFPELADAAASAHDAAEEAETEAFNAMVDAKSKLSRAIKAALLFVAENADTDKFKPEHVDAMTTAQLFYIYTRIFELTDPMQAGNTVSVARTKAAIKNNRNRNAK